MKILEFGLYLNEFYFLNIRENRNRNISKFEITSIYFETELDSLGKLNKFYNKNDASIVFNSNLTVIKIESNVINDTVYKFSTKFNYLKWPVEWHFHIAKIIIAVKYIQKNFLNYDFYILSDCDEIFLDNIYEIISDAPISSFPFRIGQDFYLGSPWFKYNVIWPGPLIYNNKKFLEIDPFDFAIHNQNKLESISKSGYHMTYLGDTSIIKQKLINSSEGKHKRSRLAYYFGIYLLKLGIDPFFRRPYFLQLSSDNYLFKTLPIFYSKKFIQPYYLALYINKFILFLFRLVNKKKFN